MTEVTIAGEEFLLDGRPTYEGRYRDGHKVQGLLFNVRAVQATFDDANRETRDCWAYPDTGVWDPERNVREFCAALPSWRAHGVLAFTANFQGGGALYSRQVYDRYDNNGFTPEGDLKPEYAERMERVIAAADALGMVVILGLFYWRHMNKLRDERAVWRAARSALDFLTRGGHRNVLIEVANETHERFGYDLFRPEQAHEMIAELRDDYPSFLYSTSLVGADPRTGSGMPPDSLVAASDYVLLHGNGATPEMLAEAIRAVRALPAWQERPKPIVINEDSVGMPNLEAAWREYASWGYFDQGYGGDGGWGGDLYVDFRSRPRESRYEDLSGFQTPPVNWGINTPHKRAFFARVAAVTGTQAT
jgi:hypothetical protein